jgi:hypothetical protein
LQKASIALSLEMFLVELHSTSQREMYDLKDSSVSCTHSRSSSKDVGLLDVPLKLVMKIYLSSSHDQINSGRRLLRQALVESLRCSCNSCIALSLDPPPTVMTVRKYSSHILGSGCQLNLATPSLMLRPFGSGVVWI